jgi:hypothetical protein
MKISANKTINIDFTFSSEDVLSLKGTLSILEYFEMFIRQELHQRYELIDFIKAMYGDFTEFIEELVYRSASVETQLAEFIEEKGKEIVF